MHSMRWDIILIVSLVAFAIPASADVLVPEELQPGDTYHLLFATSETYDGVFDPDQDGSAIAAANAAVNDLATRSPLTAGPAWYAVISDATQNARDLISDDSPVFNTRGERLAPKYADMMEFYSPIFAEVLDEMGEGMSYGYVWTGMNGLGAAGVAPSFWTLGEQALAGRPEHGGCFLWCGSSAVFMINEVTSHGVYAVSEQLRVPMSEPDTVALQAGDADQDLDFDQRDLVQVQVAARYLTGQPATWGEGDFNGAPGGYPGNPPDGDGVFDQLDIIAAIAGGKYLTGPYAARTPDEPLTTASPSLVYTADTGELTVLAPAGLSLSAINVDSAVGIFTGDPAVGLGGSFDNDSDTNLFKATLGGTFGSVSFGTVAEPGLLKEFILNDISAIGVVSGGGGVVDVDLVYVPEPLTLGLLAIAVAAVLMVRGVWNVRHWPLLVALISIAVFAAGPVSAGQIPLTPESVIGGSGAWNAERWNSGPFAAGNVADNQTAVGINESEQDSGGANGGFWLGKEGDTEEFFVLDLGREYRIGGLELFQTHNATFNNGSTSRYRIHVGNSVEPIDKPDEPQAGGMDLADPMFAASGNLQRRLFEDDPIEPDWVSLRWPNPCSRYLRFSTVGPLHSDPITPQRSVGLNEIKVYSEDTRLAAGDADMDMDHDQLDIVQVLQAAKYLTGEPVTWGEGDWDGAPGGSPGNPPQGNGVFDQLDVIAALGTSYLTGPYAELPCGDERPYTGIVPEAITPGGVRGDDQTSIVYDTRTGEIAVDAPVGNELTSINIDSTAAIFTGTPVKHLGGTFDNDVDNNIFKASFVGSFGSLSFGYVAQTDMSEEFLLNDLKVVGSLAAGGDLGSVDLVYKICEFFGQELTGADFRGRDERGVCFADANITEADFRGANLADASFVGATAATAQFRQALLQRANFQSARLNGADFGGANLNGAHFDQAVLTDANLSQTELVEATFDQAALTDADLSRANLVGAKFHHATLRNADLSNADLREASFAGSTLSRANLTDAVIRGAAFGRVTSQGFTQEQLYSTASYQAKELGAISLYGNNLSGWDFAGQNLAGASLQGAFLARANLNLADLRGAAVDSLRTALTRNTILPDGTIDGLDLDAAEILAVRDHETAITVNKSMSLGETSTLEVKFEDATWESTIHVAPRVTPELGGELALNLKPEADTNAMIDVALPVFNWNGQLPPGEGFDRIASQPGVEWDTTQLYTTGNVRLTGVAMLMPGDANRDLMYDQQDLVQVLQAGKYLTGEPATWGEGDWDAAPGGWWGSPPVGDGVFDQFDLIASLAGPTYLIGPYASIGDHTTPLKAHAAVDSIHVPEPSPLILTVAGLVGVVLFGKRPRSLLKKGGQAPRAWRFLWVSGVCARSQSPFSTGC